MENITVISYDPSWPELFEREASLLRQALGEDMDIEHVGSTSVPGLDAKPVIDIMLGLKELNPPIIIGGMESIGYEHWKEDTFQHIRLMFTKWNKNKSKRFVNVHATVKGNDFWNELLELRDRLRSDQGLARNYAKLKRELAEKYKNDPEGYTSAKTEFVRKALSG